MTYYGGKELAASFRTARGNTIRIAEEIPESKYDFRAAPDTRTVGQTLTHILKSARERFALVLEGLPESFLAESVIKPPGADPVMAQAPAARAR